MAKTTTTERHCVGWPKDALRVAFGVIWAVDATLKWLPGFRASYMDTISGMAKGQPGWLHPWFSFWINLQQPRAMLFVYLVATVETLIAAALILGFTRKLTYTSPLQFSACSSGRRRRASAGPTPQGHPTSVPPSSTPWSSPACWP